MNLSSPRLHRSVLGVATAGLVLTLAGCGSDGATAGSGASASPSAGTSAQSPSSASPSSTAVPTPKVVDGSITATDKSFTMSVPDGWTSGTSGVPRPFVVAVKDANDPPVEQILVSSFPGEASAAETAERTAQGISGQTGQNGEKIACDPTTVAGRSVVDCHYADQGKQVRKMLFPFAHDGSSALMLFQTAAATKRAAYTQVEPFLTSWRWADGSRLAKG